MLQVRYTEHRTNQSVLEEITNIADTQVPLIVSVRKRKLQWFGHAVRTNRLPTMFLEGCVSGSRGRGRPRLSWLSNVLSWTGMSLFSLLSVAHDREAWRAAVHIFSQRPDGR